MASVELRQVHKRFGVTKVVEDIDLDVQDGQFVVLVGPSGCGKSTLLRMIAGLEPVSSGQISIGQRDVTYAAPKDRNVAMVFQDYALYPHMTVRDNIGFGLKIRGMSAQQIASEVTKAARMLEIEALLDRRPAALSGGQRQRVAMGRCLVRSADAFLFDEPLSNLDAKLRATMRAEIKQFHRKTGVTTIYVTHDQVEAMTLADRIICLEGGQISQQGSPDDLYARPANTFVAGFIGSPPMNFLRGRVENFGVPEVVLADNQRLPLPERLHRAADPYMGREITVGLRPEHLMEGSPESPGVATLQVAVDLVEPLGADTLVHARIGMQALISRCAPRSGLAAATLLNLQAELGHIHLFDTVSGLALSGPDHKRH
jgi:multiple sugar transport system ATP-binding protein